MLDDLKMIHTRDSQDALGVAEKMHSQLRGSFELENGEGLVIGLGQVTSVLFVGSGSALLAAEMGRVWPGYDMPFEVCGSYELPRYANARTLVIAADYAGDDLRVVSMLRQAVERGAKIVVVTSGGRLREAADAAKQTLISLPAGLQTHQTSFYFLKALCLLMGDKETAKELDTTAAWLEDEVTHWLPTVDTASNSAKQIALELAGKSVVVYGGSNAWPAAYGWKLAINNNAKQLAWCGRYPEAAQNDLAGWTKQPVLKPYAVIDIRSDLEHAQVQKSFELSERLLSGVRPSPTVVQAKGETQLQQLLHTVCLGEFVSLYLALLAGTDPVPADIVRKFQKEIL